MKFNYVQIGAKDVEKLKQFYMNVCDCTISDKTYLLNGKEGVVLNLPGFDNESPVLGIIKAKDGSVRNINDRGFAHNCFETIDMKAAIKRLVDNGGSFQSIMDNPYKQPCVYCKDIEGNVVEFHIPFPSKDSSALNTVACLLQLRRDRKYRKNQIPSSVKYIHVNSICEDWRDLLDYYNNTFGYSDFGKIKDHEGSFKESVIGVKGVHVVGKHALAPNYHLSYPTIEIFEYSIKGSKKINDTDKLGINAIGYFSTNIEEDLKLIEKNGGKIIKKVSDKVTLVTDKQGSFIYIYS